MSELQQETDTEVQDELDTEQDDQSVEQDSEDQGESSDSASATDETGKDPAKVEFTPEQQEVFNRAIADKVRKHRDTERELERERQRIKELEDKLPKEGRPHVPELPDPYDVDQAEYKRRVQERDEALRKAAQYDAQQQYVKQQKDEQRENEQQQQQQKLYEKVESYTQRATQLGVKPEELQQAGDMVAQFDLDESIVQFILDDDQGPLITKYLASDLNELANLRNMPPTYAAARIASEIKRKAAALKPKVSQAPDPGERPRSAGTGPKAKGPKGATFE